ncbi:hypothetical protein BIU95_06960 [Curtobacterium sp. MCBA15_007]|uniref:PLDc N-terminal domain-containing protein n=1 Tax=Curtobacterium TaxID=2034 RepID=UPI0005ACC635|nr:MULTISPECIES: PLDc N-terminal domain-containing protein [Curtobacterium]KIQ07664.1 hypothetical protein RU06_10820 [Curtobacterium flaccumfaciens]MCT9620384.1 PLDc N-terminal domain-containing protein [Curtobacterium sp. C2H10]MDK8172285.1 PLDc N-terminal domain-containing protein [Curtobacterium citreum]OII01418.1 hypothetical protein BIU95_06960 [Curtobacterium sp. MCBA15_007]OII11657.1 hypothetical protein BIU97_07225 [Curtobacterium sp. MCBA15_009]
MNNLAAWHLLVIAVYLAFIIVALVQVARDRRRSGTNKVVWVVIIVLIPVIGFVGWFIDWVLGAVTRGLDRRNSRTTG